MLSAVSLILALALFTMPAGNPSAESSRITISGFTIQSEDYNYAPDASLSLYSDTQDEMQTLGLYISASDGTTPVSVSAANDGNEIFLSFGSNEHYYILSDEAVSGLTGDGLSDGWDSVLSTALSLSGVFAKDEATAYSALSEYFDAFVSANAVSAADYTDTIGDITINGKIVKLDVSLSHLLQSLDTLSASETDGVAALAEEILNAVNTTQNTDYTSFSELAETFSGSGNVLPVSLTIAVDEAGTVSRQVWSSSSESDESAMDILSQLDTDGENVSLTFNLNKENLSNVLSISLTSTLDMKTEDTGELKGAFTVSSKNVSDDDSASEENAPEAEYSEIALDFTSDFNAGNTETVITGTSKITGTDPSVFSLNIKTRKEEDNAVSDVSFTSNENSSETPLSVAFTVTASSAPYSNPFNGSVIEINSDLSSDPGASILLISDVFELSKNLSNVFGSDAPVLMDDNQLYSFVNQLFASGETVNAAGYAESADTDATLTNDATLTENEDEELTEDTEYIVETDPDTVENTDDESGTGYETIEEAAAVYSGTLPDIKTPDGYHIQDITADAESVLIEFTDDKNSYISVFIINDAEVFDEYPVYYDNEDGTVYAAELLVNGINVSVYIPDMQISDAEALFTQMGLK